jgi:type I restriction enzyme S subunit
VIHATDYDKETRVISIRADTLQNPEFWAGGNINWPTPKDMSNLADKVLIGTERRITAAGLGKISSGLLPVDTVVMSSRAPVGYLALAKIPVAVNQGYIAMRCDQALSPEFLVQWCSANMDEIKNRASGTTFAEISKKNFKMIAVVVPSPALTSTFSKQVRQLYLKIEMNAREAKTLAELRDTLLPKLLSGELTIPDAESKLAETEESANV